MIMPTYDYQCLEGHVQEEFRFISKRNELVICKLCNNPMTQIISGGFRDGMIGYPYDDPILGVEITGPSHKRKVLKQQGLIERG